MEILEYKHYAQKCPRQLLPSMQQFVKEHLDIMCSESGEEMKDFMLLARDQFISAMLRMHAADFSRKWRLMIQNAKTSGKIRPYPIYLRSICRKFLLLDECYWSVPIVYPIKKS